MWSLGDAPELHPLWEQQVEAERGMMRTGASAFHDRVVKAETRDNMTRLKPVRALLEDWLPEMAGAVKGWLRDVELSKGGPKPVAYPLLKEVDPFVASLVALRAVLDSITTERRGLTGLAMEIGRTIEHEQQVRLWEKQDPKMFYHYQKDFKEARSTQSHQRKVNIGRFNALLNDPTKQVEWRSWSEDEMFRVGVALLDVLIRKTGWFEIQEDPNHAWKKGRHNRAKLIFAAKEGLTTWLGKAFDHAEVTMPEYRPTVMPPKRWSGSRGGGYYTPYVRAPRLVRFKASQEQQKDFAADEYDAIDMPKVYAALHVLQETAWKINDRVFQIAQHAFAHDMQIAGLPRLTEEELPPRSARQMAHLDATRRALEAGQDRPKPDPETDRDILAWKKKAVPIYRRNAKRTGHARSATATLRIAMEYRNYDRFYFPHMLDFRGRMYPIPVYLQPQGDDLARGLLTFADGLPITEENGGAGWLAVALATAWGFDKDSFEERIAWVEEREALWRRIAADPLTHLEWSVTTGPDKVDKPWQALAAILEWVAYLNVGPGYVSHLPVMLDGTCNGIQILSAITRDEVAGPLVNLTPGPKPRDIYKHIATKLQAKLERIARAGGEEGRKATYWLDLCQWEIPRTATKRQVMVLPYGGTKDSFYTYTRKWLDEHDPVGEDATEEDNAFRNACLSFCVLHMWDTVNEQVTGAMKVMRWLQACAKEATKGNQPIYWVTPSGFVVRHFYGLVKEKQVDIKLDGTRCQIVLPQRSKELSVKEQLQGIAPNFVHSIDAACLVACLNMCHDAGIEDFAAIHDAYGTHAANVWPLFRLLREAFVVTLEQDVLGNFREACANILVPMLRLDGLDSETAALEADTILPKPLESGALDLSLVRESDYFFA